MVRAFLTNFMELRWFTSCFRKSPLFKVFVLIVHDIAVKSGHEFGNGGIVVIDKLVKCALYDDDSFLMQSPFC